MTAGRTVEADLGSGGVGQGAGHVAADAGCLLALVRVTFTAGSLPSWSVNGRNRLIMNANSD